MVRQPLSAPAGPHRSVVFYVRMRTEDVSQRMPYQPRPRIYWQVTVWHWPLTQAQ
jgi:hypothetical protein